MRADQLAMTAMLYGIYDGFAFEFASPAVRGGTRHRRLLSSPGPHLKRPQLLVAPSPAPDTGGAGQPARARWGGRATGREHCECPTLFERRQ